MARVILGLGSNLGDRLSNLRRALVELSQVIEVETVSSLYETEPVGFCDQPWFFNAVCIGTTDSEPMTLLARIKEIERKLGRRPSVRYGPRSIDVDILFYDDRIIATSELQVPHPRLAERAFVLVPLTEVAPQLVHPVIGRTMSETLAGLERTERVRLRWRDWLGDDTPLDVSQECQQ